MIILDVKEHFGNYYISLGGNYYIGITIHGTFKHGSYKLYHIKTEKKQFDRKVIEDLLICLIKFSNNYNEQNICYKLLYKKYIELKIKLL